MASRYLGGDRLCDASSKAKMKYCNNCGSPFSVKVIENKPREFCLDCKQIYYEQLKVGVGALIEQDNKLLLLKRLQQPFMDMWNIPAGYVEIDENPIQAVIREVEEETRLNIEPSGIKDIYFFTDDPRGNGILIVYQCKIRGGKLTESIEASSPSYFRRNDIPERLAGGGHNQAIKAWKEEK